MARGGLVAAAALAAFALGCLVGTRRLGPAPEAPPILAPVAADPPPPPPPPPRRAARARAAPCTQRLGRLRLAVGVITAPANFDRRSWIRRKLRVTDAACRGVRVIFVLGSRNHMSREAAAGVAYESQAHGDVVFVPARDWVPHAVAEKSLAWWQHAEAHIDAEWCVKMADCITARR